MCASVVAPRVRRIKSDEKKNEMMITATCASDDCSSRVLNVQIFKMIAKDSIIFILPTASSSGSANRFSRDP